MTKFYHTNVSYDTVNVNESSNLEIPPGNLVPENQSKHFLSTLSSIIQGRGDSVAIVGIVALVVICLMVAVLSR